MNKLLRVLKAGVGLIWGLLLLFPAWLGSDAAQAEEFLEPEAAFSFSARRIVRRARAGAAGRRAANWRSTARQCHRMMPMPVAQGMAHITGCSASSGRMRTDPKAMKAV